MYGYILNLSFCFLAPSFLWLRDRDPTLKNMFKSSLWSPDKPKMAFFSLEFSLPLLLNLYLPIS